MLIYCIIFIVFVLLSVEYEVKPIPKENFWLAFIGLFLAVLAGLRDVSVSRDYEPYLGSFIAVMHGDANGGIGLLPLFEPGFVAIVKFSYYLFPDNGNISVMLIFAFLSMSTKMYAIKKVSFNPYLVLLLYFCHYFMFQEMTQIRNGLACSLFFLAILAHLQNERLKAVAFILLACLFHNSASLYLLLIFLRKDVLNKYLYIGLFLLSMILGILKIPFLSMFVGFDFNLISNKLTTYVDIAEKGYFSNVRFFNVLNTINFLMTGYFLFYGIYYKVKEHAFILFLKCNIISIFMYGLLIDVPSMAARFSELYGAVFPFLFAYGARFLPFNKLNIFFMVAIAVIFLYINLFYGGLLNPYKIIPVK